MADKKKSAAAPSKGAAPPEAAAAHPTDPPFKTDSMEEAYRHFLPEAEALAEGDVPVRGGDVTVARRNIDRGVEAIRAHLDTIRRVLPLINVKGLLELPALALGLVHADGRVSRAGSAGEIDAAFARVSGLRELGLRYLEVAGELGLLPMNRVRAIRAGKGKLDNARDCVDIAGVFQEFDDQLAKKHPFTEEQLKELATTGTWLVQKITPRGTVKASSARDPAAAIRDRFWKLVDDRHNDLRTVGVALFGIKRVDDLVPPLLSRVPASAPKPAAPPDGST